MKIFRNQKGQGMTEYIIIVAVIALAGIAAFSYFGKTVRNQTAAMSESLAGDAGKASDSVKDAGTSAGKAQDEGKADVNLQDYVDRQNQGSSK